MEQNFFKRILALLLCLVMAFSTVSTALAIELPKEDVINYVSLGDSMTNGFGFEGYHQGEADNENFASGTNVYGINTYPDKFADWLKDTTNKEVKHTKLALSGMRAEEMNYLLGGRATPTDDRWGDNLSQVRYYSGHSEWDDGQFKTFFQNAITDADIITMCIGNASFGAYLLDYLSAFLGMSWDGSYNYGEFYEALTILSEGQREVILGAYNKMMDMAEQYLSMPIGKGTIIDLIDMMAYISVGFLLNYERTLDRIVALNPDVEVILVGLINTTYGLSLSTGGITIPFGDIVDILFDALNTYIAAVPAVKQAAGEWTQAKFYFAEAPDEPDFIAKQFGTMWAGGWKNNGSGLSAEILRDRTVTAYNGICNLFKLPEISYEEDINGVKLSQIEWDLSSPTNLQKQISTVLYLALEEALATTTDVTDIKLDGVMGFLGGKITEAFGKAPFDLSSPTSLMEYLNNDDNTPEEMKNDFVKMFTGTETGRSICKAFAMIRVGDGMSAHPTPDTHDEVYKSVVNAYMNRITVQKYLIHKLGSDSYQLLKYLREHGSELLEKVGEIYDKAYNSGMIPEEVNDAIVAIKQAATTVEKVVEVERKVVRGVATVAVVGGVTYLGVSAVRHMVDKYQAANSQPEMAVSINTVSDAQQWLNDNYDAGLTVDGGYGNMTKQAIVKALQMELGFTGADVDGVAGQKTLNALPELNGDSQGNTVVLLQCLLLGSGYGSDVEQAVLALQKAQGMAQTGVCDSQVWKALLG